MKIYLNHHLKTDVGVIVSEATDVDHFQLSGLDVSKGLPA